MTSFDRARIVLDVADAPHHRNRIVLVGLNLPIGASIHLIAHYSRGRRSLAHPRDRSEPIEGPGGRRHHPILRGASAPGDSVRDRLSATAMARYGFAPIHLGPSLRDRLGAPGDATCGCSIPNASMYSAEPAAAIRIGMAP